MFSKIFTFEIKYRLHRPAVYVYFLACFVFTFLSFANGAMPLDEKQWANGTSALAFFTAMMSFMMMLVNSSVMGIPLYRDIEHNTKEYYLSYPITKAGYFWGRYLSSFLFVLIIDSAVMLGAYLGSKAGPAFHWLQPSTYGPNHFSTYFYPFVTIAIPNLFFTSSLFFGLVAITRNVKVIYSAGILLMLGYLLSNFFIGDSQSKAVIYLSDPFCITAVKFGKTLLTTAEKNTMLMPMTGLVLLNRIIWVSVGAIILAYTYFSFSFEKFFGGRTDKKAAKTKAETKYALPLLTVNFDKAYTRKTLYTLTKIEVLNIMRDNYFWIIIAAGSIFLGIVFTHGPGSYWVRDFPRTSTLVFLFNNNFLVFIFCIIMFYTGEAVHRERITRYAFINDALPPPDVILNFSKFLGIIVLAVFLTFIPMLIGVVTQLAQGYTRLDIGMYLSSLLGVTLPDTIEMVMFAFAMHIVINNKFAALGTGIALWILIMLADESGWMNYHLLLYNRTPYYGISDFDGIGHMWKPLAWFNAYWLLTGSLMVVVGYLFYVRGTITAFKERMQLAKERFTNGKVRLTAGVLAIVFFAVLAYNYYNISYVNTYYTNSEYDKHAALMEKQLKHYEDMPLPCVTSMKVYADLYPSQQKAMFKSLLTLANNTNRPITELLLDGDNLNSYTLTINGAAVPYTCPLFFNRSKFNFLKPAMDSSSYRLYKLTTPIAPGGTATAEVNSNKEYTVFTNGFYGADLLHNGTTIGMGLPDLGYDDDEEIDNEEDRKKYGLPHKEEDFPLSEDSAGAYYTLAGKSAGLPTFDITVSTEGDQTALAPGDLVKQWVANGRNYYQYVYSKPGLLTGLGIASARYAVLRDSVALADGQEKSVGIYYHPQHNANLQRFMAAYKDGLAYFSTAYGPYPFKSMSLAESPIFSRTLSSVAALDIYSERFGWNANFTNPNQWDYCYFIAADQLAKQWWGKQVAPSHTRGAGIIADGLPKYAAMALMEKKFGENNIRNVIGEELDSYIWQRGRTIQQNPLLSSVRGNEENNKAALVLLGLQHFIGQDSLNAALREFYNAYAFKTTPPYAGAKDLYYYLKKHTPDSLQYYVTDAWEKITFYDNRVVSATATPLKNNQYKVTLTISTNKVYQDNDGNEQPAKNMDDYMDIAVFAADTPNKEGRMQANLLYNKRYKFTAGEHTIDVIVNGKPATVGIDPFMRLIDRNMGDNLKEL